MGIWKDYTGSTGSTVRHLMKPDEPAEPSHLLSRALIVGIRYSRNARAKSSRGLKSQSRRAAESSTSSGQVSTMLCRFLSTSYLIEAEGNARRASWRTSSAVGANARTLYAVCVNRV